MVDGFGAVRLFAYYQYGLSELAVCDPRFDCRPFLRLDVAQDQFDICVGHRAWAGRYYLAFLFPDFLTLLVTTKPRCRPEGTALQDAAIFGGPAQAALRTDRTSVWLAV